MSNYHVTKHPDGGWQYKKAGAVRAAGIASTQRKAELAAKQILSRSGGGEVRIHGRDGKIRDSDTVHPAKDPFPPRDMVH